MWGLSTGMLALYVLIKHASEMILSRSDILIYLYLVWL